MTTILFFSRLALTDMYGQLDEKLNKKYNIIHVAYSNEEEKKLREEYGIKKIINFKQRLNNKLLKKEKLDYILLEKINQSFIKTTQNRFSLNASIQSDRTFVNLEYEESLLLTQIYYKIWKEIFLESNINFFVHEATSLMINHIACLICKEENAIYLNEIQVEGENKYDILFMNFDGGYPIELKYEYENITTEEILNNEVRIQKYIYNFQKSYEVFFNQESNRNNNFFQLLRLVIKSEVKKALSKGKINKLNDSIEYFLTNDSVFKKKFINLIKYKFYQKWDVYDSNKKYYFYPLHLEPEATVLYWGDGLYKNQVKLIENIAAQLPVGVFLYVKDHPHFLGYRSIEDYKKIQEIPNVKLLDSNIPGKLIIKNSIGVITINGTGGFEGLMLDKEVYTFGKTFYGISKLVNYIDNIKDLRKVISLTKSSKSKEEKDKFVLALLKSSYEGNTDCFYSKDNTMRKNKKNIEDLAKAYEKYIFKLETIINKDN
ncbi:MAG: hypothetical protein ACRC4T_21955 [Cetobacterium sp.]